MAVIVLHEHLLWNTYAGIVFILLASFMNIRQGMWQRDIEKAKTNEQK